MKYFFGFLFIIFNSILLSQEWKVNYFGIPEEIHLEKKHTQPSKKEINQTPSRIITLMIDHGYLAASIDSIHRVDSLKQLDLYIYAGQKIEFAKIAYNPSLDEALTAIGKSGIHSKKRLTPQKIADLFDGLLYYYENKGYPFAAVKLDSISYENHIIYSQIILEKGPLIQINNIYIKGAVKNDSIHIQHLINIQPGDFYQQQLIEKVDTKLKNTPYLKLLKNSEYEFNNKGCDLFIYLDNMSTNNINGVIGILPDDAGKINITGDVKVNLLNGFYQGELISINWKKMQPLTQSLKTKFSYPYLFHSNFGADIKFDLYKRDTSFINILFQGGTRVQLGNKSLNVFYQTRNSNLLSSSQFAHLTTLPEYADSKQNLYGIGFSMTDFNYLFNPTKGIGIQLSASAGIKKILMNPELNPLAYEGIQLSSSIYDIQHAFEFYIPIKNRSTLRFKTSGGFLLNNNIFENELHRIGGYQLLRGFSEESIFASSYVVNTIEYRYILEEKSHLFIFTDGAWYEAKTRNKFSTDTPLGVGTGIRFSTKPGIFSISYALGREFDNPFLFRTAQIHFGFVNLF